jgi:hypothetical protein
VRTKARSSFFIDHPSRFEDSLAATCRFYHSLRQTDKVIALGQRYPDVTAQFYTELAQGGIREDSRFQINNVSDRIKPRVIQALGIGQVSKSPSIARKIAHEAIRWAAKMNDPYTIVSSYVLLAVACSNEGENPEALSILLEGLPLVRSLFTQFPVLYFNYLNPLAVELAASGDLATASRVISVSLASPFARFYPEWAQTLEEINILDKKSSPSVIYLPSAPPTRTTLRLVRKENEVMQAGIQPNKEDLAVQIMGDIEDAVWHIGANLENGDKLKVLNYIYNLGTRAKVGTVSA